MPTSRFDRILTISLLLTLNGDLLDSSNHLRVTIVPE
jgi:hypothetical protein